jgi:protein phosphatase
MTQPPAAGPDWSRSDRRDDTGPFDIIGDVHGCAAELETLLGVLGYRLGARPDGAPTVTPPAGRRAVFVGDLVDRGPRAPDVLRLVIGMVEAGAAFCVPGNHDVKLLRWLSGKQVKPTHGLDRTITQFEGEPFELRERVRAFLLDLPPYLWLDRGLLAVAHAGIKEEMLGRLSGTVRQFCLYGETSGETDEFGLPIRYHWAAEYRGKTAIVYGHTPVPEADWVNNTICIDTGCCFGGHLSALRWPEREIVRVAAERIYSPPMRPFGHPPVRPGASA